MDAISRVRDFLSKRGIPGGVWIALAAFAIVLAADQASKFYVVDGLNLKEVGSINVIDPYLNFRMAWNTGVNFGIGGGNPAVTRIPLIAFSILFTIGALVFSRRSSTALQAAGLGVAAGGALGNAIDRLNWGAVADFLNMSCCGFVNPWSFNVADIAIFAGIAMAFLFDGKSKT